MTEHRHWCFLSWASLCGLWHFCLSPLRTLYLWSVFMSQEIISRFFAQLAVLGSDLDVTFPHPPPSTHFRKLIVSPNFLAYLFLNVGGTYYYVFVWPETVILNVSILPINHWLVLCTVFIVLMQCYQLAVHIWMPNHGIPIYIYVKNIQSIYFLSSSWALWSGLHHRSLCSNDVVRLSGAFVVKITRCISTAVKI